MITLNNITLRRGAKVLLDQVNWTIYHKQRIGLIGANGAGKTSLFSMLLGELQPDLGDLETPKQLKLAHVAQETPAYAKSAIDFVLEGDHELQQIQQALTLAEQLDDGHQIAHCHARMSEIDAYTAEARAAQLLAGLGFTHAEQQQSVNSFSGGWRVRLNLAQALMSRSDVLLLDEPTNHLDLDAVLWLQNWLKYYPGTLILISHDRDFLDEVVDHIAHISHQQLKIYAGNYSSFEKQLATHLMLQQAAFEKQQKHVAHLQQFINRFKAKASKAKQAQSRMKALERMEIIDAVHKDSPFQFSFREPKKCPNPLIHLQDASVQYGDKVVLSDLNLTIAPEHRFALLGPNGAGKSSLIKLLAGEISPATGVRTTGAGLVIGYFAQHQIDHLKLDESPLEHLRELAQNHREQELRGFLGSFGFSDNRTQEAVRIFSGGEKSRLALALIVWQQPNILLLDEPTNHLDLDMRHALSLALQHYQGAMILVSHDRFLVRSTVDELMLVANGELIPFTGDLDEYEKWLIDYRKQQTTGQTTSFEKNASKKSQRKLDAKERELRRPLIQQVKQAEVAIEKLEKKATAMELRLADPKLYLDEHKSTLTALLQEQKILTQELKVAEQQWLTATEKLDALGPES